jgi:SAM-dependent methyltransferase
MQTTTRYSFDNAWQHANERLGALEAWLDPGTQRHLEARGVGPGWHCLEVGAGRGSVAAWLLQRVAPSGRVVATDIDPRHLRPLESRGCDVLEHDIQRDKLPADSFDLIHMRLLLAHLHDHERALDHIIGALKPGGWLVAEEMDFSMLSAEPHVDVDRRRIFGRLVEAHHRITGARGFQPFFGRRLFSTFVVRGLRDVGAEGREFVCTAGSPGSRAWRLTFEQLGHEMVSVGAATRQEIDAGIAMADDPSFAFRSQLVVAAWGGKP